jgi:hypothetical protein
VVRTGFTASGRTSASAPGLAPTRHQDTCLTLSVIRTVTVGPGISPGLLTLRTVGAQALAALVWLRCRTTITAGGELHPALRTLGTRPVGRTWADCRKAAQTALSPRLIDAALRRSGSSPPADRIRAGRSAACRLHAAVGPRPPAAGTAPHPANPRWRRRPTGPAAHG